MCLSGVVLMAVDFEWSDVPMGIIVVALAVAGYMGLGGQWAFDLKTEEKKIMQEIIQSSIRGHAGKCACPYSIGWDGKKCGSKSAYKKQGKRTTLICYNQDIPESMMQKYRRKYRLPEK